MKKILCMFLVIATTFHPVKASEYYAKNYIVMEASSGQVLEGKAIHDTQSVASISKIMTAIIAIENDDLTREVTIGEEIKKAYGSGVYIHQCDQITIQDLLYGLMLRSGNDAALCLAYHVGGKNLDNFVQMMNDKAQEIGMKNTVFHNPSGLDEEDEGNISSVYDMALLMRYCMQNETFQKITATKTYKRLDGNGTWHNKNKLLEQYEYCTGGKTGFTKKAKRTLVTSAQKDGVSLIIVTFNCGDDFGMHQNLYETYFQIYEQILCLDRGVYDVGDKRFYVDKPVYQALSIDTKQDELTYHLDQQDEIGIYYQDVKIASYPLVQDKFPVRYFFEALL